MDVRFLSDVRGRDGGREDEGGVEVCRDVDQIHRRLMQATDMGANR